MSAMNIEIIQLSENLQVKHVEREEFVILSGKYRIKASRSCIMKLLDQFHRAESLFSEKTKSFEELRNGFSGNKDIVFRESNDNVFRENNNNRSESDI